MRIAVVAHVRHPISAPFMGGMEAHSWHLANALARRGHDVTLLASADSEAGLPRDVTLEPILDLHYDTLYPWHDFHGTDVLNDHVDAGFARAGRTLLSGAFDVIHNNSLHRYPPRLARRHRLPMVTSLHVPPFAVLARAVQASAAPWCRVTATSRRQRDLWWPNAAPDEAHVVHNGIDPALWPYRPGGDGTAIWAGRITPTKGLHVAVEAALHAGIPLTIHGTVEHADYFDARVRPFLGDTIRYGGHVEGPALARAYAEASVLMFTPLWEEPFGLAAIEAMSTGLPVAALDNGAVREVVGPAGCFAADDTPTALADAMTRALSIAPEVARNRVFERFTLDRMIDGYERCYARARAGIEDADLSDVSFSTGELDVMASTVDYLEA